MSGVEGAYEGEPIGDVIHDYAITRGDLTEQYARDQLAAIVRTRLAQAWREGHAAGRDYQGDGWNSDAHDPERDNPYEETP